MKELIVRISDTSKDVEMLFNNLITNEITEKNLSFDKFIEILSNYVEDGSREVPCSFIEAGIIAIGQLKNNKKIIVKQPEHQRYITYSVGDENKAFKINFPSSIYVVSIKNNVISELEAYMYFEDLGKETILYKYGMPNMLGANKICMGNVDRTIKDSVIKTLENIIYAPYSHAELNNVKSFHKTTAYFEYLQDNYVEKKHLYAANKKLKELVN